MKKIILLVLLSLLFFSNSFAAEATGQPTKYEVTMKKLNYVKMQHVAEHLMF